MNRWNQSAASEHLHSTGCSACRQGGGGGGHLAGKHHHCSTGNPRAVSRQNTESRRISIIEYCNCYAAAAAATLAPRQVRDALRVENADVSLSLRARAASTYMYFLEPCVC